MSLSVQAESAREGAAFDPSGGPYAPIVFSHGATNDPIDYAHTLEAIADAGFIVVAPTHTNNTQDDVRRDYINSINATRLFACQDGLPARPKPELNPMNGFPGADCAKDKRPEQHGRPRPRRLGGPGRASAWFGDDVDVQRAGVMGHSRGTVPRSPPPAAASRGASTASPTRRRPCA